jgi:periplasmic protein TonB
LDRRGSPIRAIGLPRSRSARIATAAATVLCLHAALLLLKLDGSGSRHAAGARVMAVRMLPTRPVDLVRPREPQIEPSLVAHREREQAEPATAAAPADAGDSRAQRKLAERAPIGVAAAGESPPRVEPAPAQPPTRSSPADAALPSAPDYLFGARLDPGPRPIGDIEPEYPESANLQEGKVVLRLLISEAGVVDNVAVVRADPKGVFDEAALEAFRVARFSPGMVLGTPVKSQITVEVEFVPINRGARISGRTY